MGERPIVLEKMIDEWLETLRTGGYASPNVRAVFVDWLLVDRSHLEAFVLVVGIAEAGRRARAQGHSLLDRHCADCTCEHCVMLRRQGKQ